MIRAARLLFVSVVSCATAHASVIYDFSGNVNFIGAVELFRYTAPAFITADIFIPVSALDLCSTGQTLPCFGVNFLPSGPDTPQHYPELTFQTRNPDNSVGTVFYYFPLGSSFAAYGRLTNVPSLGNEGALTVCVARTWSALLTTLCNVSRVPMRSVWPRGEGEHSSSRPGNPGGPDGSRVVQIRKSFCLAGFIARCASSCDLRSRRRPESKLIPESFYAASRHA